VIDIRLGDCLDVLRTIPDGSARMCVTSPPYFGLRDYGVDGQIGLEATPDVFVAKMVEVFREVRRVLAEDGTLWLNLGDSYAATGKSGGGDQGKRWEECGADTSGPRGGKWSPAPDGYKPKDLLGIPWRVAFALQADGWYLRSDIIWHKPNPMPESVRDRPTKAHEYLFLLSKQPRYYYDAEAVREPVNPAHRAHHERYRNRPVVGKGDIRGDGNGGKQGGIGYPASGRNARTVWTITPRPFKGAHFATFPAELAERCIKAGSSERGKCPECGAAWVRVVERTGVIPGGEHEDGRERVAIKGDGCEMTSMVNDGQRRRAMNGRDWHATASIITTGWRPTCSHDLEPVPDVVLDPFAGAGTAGLVCQRLGRDHLGVELNPVYRQMAIDRIASDSPMPLLEAVS
jgi:DNA modification methylase